MAVEALDVPAADAGEDAVDLAAGAQLGFLHGAGDRLHRRLHVDHHARAQALARRRRRSRRRQRAARRQLGDHRRHLGGADVEADEQLGFLRHGVVTPLSAAPPGGAPAPRRLPAARRLRAACTTTWLRKRTSRLREALGGALPAPRSARSARVELRAASSPSRARSARAGRRDRRRRRAGRRDAPPRARRRRARARSGAAGAARGAAPRCAARPRVAGIEAGDERVVAAVLRAAAGRRSRRCGRRSRARRAPRSPAAGARAPPTSRRPGNSRRTAAWAMYGCASRRAAHARRRRPPTGSSRRSRPSQARTSSGVSGGPQPVITSWLMAKYGWSRSASAARHAPTRRRRAPTASQRASSAATAPRDRCSGRTP